PGVARSRRGPSGHDSCIGHKIKVLQRYRPGRVIRTWFFLLVGNKQAARIVVRYVNWVFWLIGAWLAGSVAVAVLFGRVIRTRDEREVPRPFHKDDTERWRDAS